MLQMKMIVIGHTEWRTKMRMKCVYNNEKKNRLAFAALRENKNVMKFATQRKCEN